MTHEDLPLNGPDSTRASTGALQATSREDDRAEPRGPRRTNAVDGARNFENLGDDAASRLHAELRALAGRLMRRERVDHTLQATALVHEAWLRLHRREDARALEPARWLALAATTMRRILVDRARRRRALKRSSPGATRDRGLVGDVACAAAARDASSPHDRELLALDSALDELAHMDPELARLVELRVFAGRGVDEIAAALGSSPRTVKRRWQFVRGWLARAIRERLA